jgi:hypothetical protein
MERLVGCLAVLLRNLFLQAVRPTEVRNADAIRTKNRIEKLYL